MAVRVWVCHCAEVPRPVSSRNGYSGVGISGANAGESVTIRIFMNKPTADAKTPADDPRCVAELPLVWQGQPINEARIIELTKARSVIGDSDVSTNGSLVGAVNLAPWAAPPTPQ